jgi:hypothetical protein
MMSTTNCKSLYELLYILHKNNKIQKKKLCSVEMFTVHLVYQILLFLWSIKCKSVCIEILHVLQYFSSLATSKI